MPVMSRILKMFIIKATNCPVFEILYTEYLFKIATTTGKMFLNTIPFENSTFPNLFGDYIKIPSGGNNV